MRTLSTQLKLGVNEKAVSVPTGREPYPIREEWELQAAYADNDLWPA